MDNFKFKKLSTDKNKLVYQVDLDYLEYKNYADKALKIEASKVKIPGFRPGQAPKEMVEKEVASKVFNRTINTILPDYAQRVLVEEKLNPISHLHYDLKDFDEQKGLVFTFEVLVSPEIESDLFKKIKVEQKDESVEESEIVEVLKNMIKNNVKKEKIPFKKKEDSKDEDFDLSDDLIVELKYEDTKTLEEAKTKVKETLLQIKKQQSESEFNNKVLEEALKAIDFYVPHEMVDDQVLSIEEDFKQRLKQINLDLESYLKTQGKTIDQIREDWRADSEKRIAYDLLLVNFAVKENLIPTDSDVELEIEKMEDQELKNRYKIPNNKEYLKTLMARERGLLRLVDIVKANK